MLIRDGDICRSQVEGVNLFNQRYLSCLEVFYLKLMQNSQNLDISDVPVKRIPHFNEVNVKVAV